MSGEERISADHERTGSHLHNGGESDIDLAFSGGFYNIDLHALAATCFLRVSNDEFGGRYAGVHQQGDHSGMWQQVGKKFERLPISSVVRKLTPVRLPSGRARLAMRPAATGLA